MDEVLVNGHEDPLVGLRGVLETVYPRDVWLVRSLEGASNLPDRGESTRPSVPFVRRCQRLDTRFSPLDSANEPGGDLFVRPSLANQPEDRAVPGVAEDGVEFALPNGSRFLDPERTVVPPTVGPTRVVNLGRCLMDPTDLNCLPVLGVAGVETHGIYLRWPRCAPLGRRGRVTTARIATTAIAATTAMAITVRSKAPLDEFPPED